ncbi:UDP-N-acetylmuramate--L-alanine ligase [Patescibacteria group bacterium]|nr:UDP-N-acetylmuramate--L-alanine ligase [Patescibacteria group bacterium]MBU1931666.1 UDP-N-acetylmuramate--L-alanine ligase [Patescibacteria group bacterium]
MELGEIKTIHFTGIKGVAMTALACCAQDLGIKISGSDLAEIFVTDATLTKRGINWHSGFSDQHLPKNLDLLVYTGAFGCQPNPEIAAAEKQGIPVLNHAQALALFTQDKTLISVAGVGGKSTVSAMLATVFDTAGVRPSFSVGVSDIPCLDAPGRYVNNSRFFIAEADEYIACKKRDDQPRFWYQRPELAIITNIEFDHPDVYADFEQTKTAFAQFTASISEQGLLVACADSRKVKDFLKKVEKPVQTYGFSEKVDWQIIDWQQGEQFQSFSVAQGGGVFGPVKLGVPGRFNGLNATATLAAATFFGLGFKQIQSGLKRFTGTKRRFELIKATADYILYDDYAHHPREIEVTLKAAKHWLADYKIMVIFQPHTYSRTRVLFKEFSQSFSLADQVILVPIYASAREKPDPQTSSYQLYQQIAQLHRQAFYVKDKASLTRLLTKTLQPKTAILTLGAGDIFLWHPEIIKTLTALS